VKFAPTVGRAKTAKAMHRGTAFFDGESFPLYEQKVSEFAQS